MMFTGVNIRFNYSLGTGCIVKLIKEINIGIYILNLLLYSISVGGGIFNIISAIFTKKNNKYS